MDFFLSRTFCFPYTVLSYMEVITVSGLWVPLFTLGWNQMLLSKVQLNMETGVQICCCSVTQSCPTLCNSMNYSTRGMLVLHCLLECSQTRVHWISDAIQPSHPLLPTSPLALNLSQYQGPFKWVSCSHQVAKVLEFQLQRQSFQWIFRTNFL